MTTGCKIWLWILFVGNLLLLAMALLLRNSTIWDFRLYVVSVTAQIAGIFAVYLMLFQRRMVGFYIFCGSIIASFLVSVVSGTNIFYAIISAIISPAITLFFISQNKDIFK